jgi:hypothetical protein
LFHDRFTIRRLSYYNLVLYPVKALFVGLTKLRRALWPTSRKRSFNDLLPTPLNELFKGILLCEAAVIERVALPFGVSLVIVARRADAEGGA